MLLHERIFLEMNNIRMIHWNAVGSEWDSLHAHTDEVIEQLCEDYDDVVELSIAAGVSIRNPMLGEQDENLINESVIPVSDGYNKLRDCLARVLNAVENVSENEKLSQALKAKLDAMAEWLDKEVNFKLARRLS